MKIWDVNDVADIKPEELEEAAELLRGGRLIAFPTETVYGLGANAWNDDAVRRVFVAKGRPSDNPLIVHIADRSGLDRVVLGADQLSAPVQRAMDAFWPGPLTIVLPVHPDIAPSVRPGVDTVGVRMPSHPVAAQLIRLARCPVAAPSANLSGRPSPTSAQHVVEDLQGRIDGVVNGGSCSVGLESTVVRIDADSAVIYRPGGVSRADLERVLRVPVEFDAHLKSPDVAPRSPGMKYKHYAPDADVFVWWGDHARIQSHIRQFLMSHVGERTAVIAPQAMVSGLATTAAKPANTAHTANTENLANTVSAPAGYNGAVPPGLEPVSTQGNDAPLTWSPEPDEAYETALGRSLYSLLRDFDHRGARYILICGVDPNGWGAAVMNRLQKAAAGRVYRV